MILVLNEKQFDCLNENFPCPVCGSNRLEILKKHHSSFVVQPTFYRCNNCGSEFAKGRKNEFLH